MFRHIGVDIGIDSRINGGLFRGHLNLPRDGIRRVAHGPDLPGFPLFRGEFGIHPIGILHTDQGEGGVLGQRQHGGHDLVVKNQVAQLGIPVFVIIEGLVLHTVVGKDLSLFRVNIIRPAGNRLQILAGSGYTISAAGFACPVRCKMDDVALVLHRVICRHKMESAVAADHAVVPLGNIGVVGAEQAHLISGNEIIRRHGVGLKMGVEILIDQAFGIPFRHGGQILSVAFLHGTVFHLAVHLIEGLGAVYQGTVDPETGTEEVALIAAAVGQHHGCGSAQFVLERSQDIIVFVIGFRAFLSDLIQPVLPDDQAVVREAGVAADDGELIDVAFVRGQILNEFGIRTDHGLIVGHPFINQIVYGNDHFIFPGGIQSAHIVLIHIMHQIPEIAGRNHQIELLGGHFRIDQGKLRFDPGPLFHLLEEQRVVIALKERAEEGEPAVKNGDGPVSVGNGPDTGILVEGVLEGDCLCRFLGRSSLRRILCGRRSLLRDILLNSCILFRRGDGAGGAGIRGHGRSGVLTAACSQA